MQNLETTVEVRNLKVYFPVTRGLLRNKVADVKAVDGVSFCIPKGKTMGLVGESGSGKTTLGRAILRLYEPVGGDIIFQGKNITHLPERKIRPLRRHMTMIFQDPYSSLNPRQSAGSIVGDSLLIHHMTRNKTEYEDRVSNLFHLVGLDPGMIDRVPHEFSGGQRQRIGIARAIACNPSLIICDEPISALDVSIQAQVINLMQELQEKFSLTYLFVAHDIAVVRHISHQIAVLYLGHIVEITTSQELYNNPLHPYTKALLSAVPVLNYDAERKRQRVILEGEIPSPLHPPAGCPFHPRCRLAETECSLNIPPLREIATGHEVACFKV